MTERRHYRPLQSTNILKRTMSRYYALTGYHRFWGKPLRRPIAWVTSGAPVELLRAFKIHPAYPEQYAAIYSSHKASEELCQVAEAAGFSQDLCSYARSNIGGVLRPDLAPLGGMPIPDLLVACNNICGTVLKWYEVLARHFNVPLLVLDTPYLTGELTLQAKTYVLEQLNEMVLELEKITKRSFNEKELEKQMHLSRKTTSLWKETRQYCKAQPSPLNAPDLFIHMAPIVVLRGTNMGVKYYQKLKEEVKQRVHLSQGAIEKERIRLVWDNIAPSIMLAGVDIGSLTVKVVFLTENREILSYESARAGYNGRNVATQMIEKMLTESGFKQEDIHATVATGYGRITFPAEREVSEITCQAKGIYHLFPNARTIIDIGGQDSKVIQLFPNGKVEDFAMNDKCAAGTGRFLEVMASALEVNLNEIGELSSQSKSPSRISSFCTVFAESEVVSQVSKGTLKADILAGVCDSVANRVIALARRIGLTPNIVFTGGVARNKGVLDALSRHLEYPLHVYKEPVITAALGAALVARDL